LTFFLKKKLEDKKRIINPVTGTSQAEFFTFLDLAAGSGVIDVQAASGETPLLLACRSFATDQKHDIIKALLKRGANTNIVVSKIQIIRVEIS